MRAVIYKGPASVAVADVAEPVLVDPGDALVRVKRSAICGTDLHVYHGHVPGIYDGMPIGHEYTGSVVAVGSAVREFAVGDEVVGSFTLACGECPPCRARQFNFCRTGRGFGLGPLFGDCGGTHAEVVRVRHADINLLGKPEEVGHDELLLVGDVMSTAWYAARRGGVAAGDVVLVVGAGPVGVLCGMAAAAQGAARVLVADTVPSRLTAAADLLQAEAVIADDLPTRVRELVPGGVDVAIESVGLPAALVDAAACVRDGGTVSVVGVHGEPSMEIPSGDMFRRGLSLHMCGPSNVQGVWHEVLEAIVDGRIEPARIISHRLSLEEAAEGYRMFDAKEAMKVVLEVG